MSRTIRVVALFAGGTVLLSCGVLVLNQTAQVVQLASTVHPTLGTITLWSLVASYTALVGIPTYRLLRLPKPLVPPAEDHGPEFDAHLERLRNRLQQNPLLHGHDLSNRQGIESALGILSDRTDAIVKQTASQIFLSTAVSQSGRLDALMVLAAQSWMVWRIARVYSQRPGAREMTYLYMNVAGTAFLAGEVGDIDVTDQVEPVLSAAISALGASLPGFQVAGAVLASCVLNGSANAFLTLRVGMIAKQFSGALIAQPKPQLRRAATAEAAKLLGAVVTEGTTKITGAVWKASKDKVGKAVQGLSGYAKDAGVKLSSVFGGGRTREQAGGVS